MKLGQWVVGAVAAVGLAATAGTASAQSFGGGQGPWTGFYVGGSAGYGWAQDSEPSPSGFVGGLYAGYNLQFGSAVVGIEGDYSFASMDASETISGVRVSVGVDSLWSIRARLGFAASRELLVFGTVGYGAFNIDGKATDGVTTVKVSDDRSGLVLGGGVDYAFTRNWIGRLEYQRYFGKGNDEFSGADGDLNVFRAGIAYKF